MALLFICVNQFIYFVQDLFNNKIIEEPQDSYNSPLINQLTWHFHVEKHPLTLNIFSVPRDPQAKLQQC